MQEWNRNRLGVRSPAPTSLRTSIELAGSKVAMWTVPLYLWASELMNDTVVLLANPAQFTSLGFADNVYSVVDAEPVAFIHTMG